MDVQKEISLRNAISYCIENNDVNTATNRIMEFIRDKKEAINFIHCCKSDSELFYCQQQSSMKHNRCIAQCDSCASKQ
jgi:hypothetical protein